MDRTYEPGACAVVQTVAEGVAVTVAVIPRYREALNDRPLTGSFNLVADQSQAGLPQMMGT